MPSEGHHDDWVEKAKRSWNMFYRIERIKLCPLFPLHSPPPPPSLMLFTIFNDTSSYSSAVHKHNNKQTHTHPRTQTRTCPRA